MSKKFLQFMKIVEADPAVAEVAGSIGGGGGGGRGGTTTSGSAYITLKPLAQRGYMATQDVIERLRPQLANIAGVRSFLQPQASVQVRAGGRQGNGSEQYTLPGRRQPVGSRHLGAAHHHGPGKMPQLRKDVNSDRQANGLQLMLKIDRDSASRMGLTMAQIDNTLNSAFSQRSVSTINEDKNQYQVIMEVAQGFWQDPSTLRDVYVSTSGNVSATQATQALTAAPYRLPLPQRPQRIQHPPPTQRPRRPRPRRLESAISRPVPSPAPAEGGGSTASAVSTAVEPMVPLSAIASFAYEPTPLAVNHQGPFIATTFSFSLPEGVMTEDQAIKAINAPWPISSGCRSRSMAQHAAGYRCNWRRIRWAICRCCSWRRCVTIYIVLGILYESYIHPLTILSTLPSAGVGAVLALLVFKANFDMIAFIGVILLIGVVKKNAIIMIDFALDVQRREKIVSA